MHDISNLRCCKSHGFQLSVMSKYCFGSIVICDFSVIDYDQSLRIFCNILHAVGYKDNSNPSYFMKLCDLVKDIIPSFRIQTCSWLIQNKNFRIHCQYTGNSNSFLLSARKFKRRFAVIFLLETYVLQCFLCFYFCLFPG